MTDDTIRTDRLLLSPPRLSDVPALFAFLGDPNTMQYSRPDESLAACRRRIAVHERRRRHDGCAPWTVREAASGRIVGWGGLYDDPFDPGWGIELAYFFAPSAWGKGYASELAAAALDFADRRLRIAEISGFAHPGNHASNAVLRKAGFTFQRYLPDMARNLYLRRRAPDEARP